MTEQDFETIARIQRRFYLAGWRWQETTFAERDEVSIRFCPNDNPFAFNVGDKSENDERRYGWGRYPRLTAWQMAEEFLLDEYIPNAIDKQRLIEYKAKWFKTTQVRVISS